MKGKLVAVVALMTWGLFAETNVINGITYVCEDGMCRMIAPTKATVTSTISQPPRIAQGYRGVEDFLAFLENRPVKARARERDFGDHSLWLILLLTLVGGLTMNLTPCVLPMIPVNMLIIGKSARRGAWYGAGMAVAYGLLGVLAAVGGLAFGVIQSSALFNLAVAVVFLALAAALFGAFPIDFSRARGTFRGGAFLMGMLAAVLAGACVAPVLIAVLLLTARLFAAGHIFALGLPFVMGLGMALPWPFVGAGLSVLPKPGAWMRWVNRVFAVVMLGFAAWYGALAIRIWAGPAAYASLLPAEFAVALERSPRPVLVDCWASWCKNCAAMERGTLADPRVKKALERFTVLRLQAEDMAELQALPGFGEILGLPAFVIFE